MIASAQFTIISLCDVVTSDTPPENPYEGQLWVDTSVTPPETKIWDGNEWVVQNDIETIRTTISILIKCSQFPSCVDFTGFNCIQNCVYCYYLSFFSKIALKHRPHYFHI